MPSLVRFVESRRLWLVAMALNAGLALGSLALWGAAYAQHLTWRADFTQFYTGWTLVIGGQGHDLYDFTLQTQVQQQILGGRYLAGGLLPFNYPPHVALLFAPLAYLALDRAYLVWSVLQLGLLGWLWQVLLRHLRAGGVDDRARALAISAALALPAVGATLLLGALSTLMLICLLNFALALRRQDDAMAGFWLVLLTLKPQFAVIPALVLVAGRRWRAIGVAVGGGLIVVVVTMLVFGMSTWVDFASALYRTLGADDGLGVAPLAMDNLRGILTFLLGDSATGLINGISLFAFGVTLIFVLWLWTGRQAANLDFDIRMAIVLLLSMLFNPHVNPQDGVLLVAPTLFFWHHLRRSGDDCRALGVLVGTCPLAFWVVQRGLGAHMDHAYTITRHSSPGHVDGF